MTARLLRIFQWTASLLVPLLTAFASAKSFANDVPFVRGDANTDGQVTLSDGLRIANWLFTSGPDFPCRDAADADDDGDTDLLDAITVIATFVDFPDFEATIPPPTESPGTDPTDDTLTCLRYDPEPARPTTAELRLAAVSGSPGELLAVPVRLRTADFPVVAIQLVVHYDPTVFTPVAPEGEDLLRRAFAESYFGETFAIDPPLGFILRLRVLPQEGVLRVAFLPSLVNNLQIDENLDVVAFNLLGRIAAEAQPGTISPLSFTEHETALGPLRNELSWGGDVAYLPEKVSGSVEVHARTFLRGDTNGDSAVNLTDAIVLLRHLFAGGVIVTCPDAADANDDGFVELTDAVVILRALFEGTKPIRPPFPEPGPDPTPDPLPPCQLDL